MCMSIVAWKESKEEDNSYRCRLQLQYTDGRKVKSLLSQLKDWKECGQGYNSKDKEEILIFIKNFKSDYLWKKFLKDFPFSIVEKLRNNKERIYNGKKTFR